MKKLTVNEYAIEKGVTPKTVYEWIRNDRVKHGKETRNNQEVTVIHVPPVQEEVKPDVLPTLNPQEQNNSLQFMEMFEYIKQVNERLITSQEKLTNYAEIVGTVKLIEDSEKRTKEECLQVTQENKTLTITVTQLKSDLTNTQKQFNDYKEQKAKEFEALQEKLKQQEEKMKSQEQTKQKSLWARLFNS